MIIQRIARAQVARHNRNNNVAYDAKDTEREGEAPGQRARGGGHTPASTLCTGTPTLTWRRWARPTAPRLRSAGLSTLAVGPAAAVQAPSTRAARAEHVLRPLVRRVGAGTDGGV